MRIPLIAALAGAALVFGATPASAQSNEEKLEKKLKEPWINNPKWITDYDEAKKEAKRTGKVIFAYFTRSYAY